MTSLLHLGEIILTVATPAARYPSTTFLVVAIKHDSLPGGPHFYFI